MHRQFEGTALLLALGLLILSGAAGAQTFSITRAEWQNSDGGRLRMEGRGIDGRIVNIRNAGNSNLLGSDTVDDDEWSRRFRGLAQVPCRVRAEQLRNGVVEATAERDVRNRPANCGPAAGGDAIAPTVSITTNPAGPTYTTAQTVTINATAADNAGGTGVARVEFYDGASLLGTDNSAPYSFAWSITAADNGTHTLTARAVDGANNVGTSAALTRTVDIPGGAAGRPNVSINSTSRSVAAIPGTPVGQQPAPNNNNSVTPAPGTGTSAFQVLAVNDLGMHCGDLDTRVSSILPPFNVLHAVALQKGASPVKLNENQVEIRYSAAANASDPILTRTNPSPILDPDFQGVYKTNFWDIARAAYAPFYPGGFLAALPDLGVDISLPVPDVETFYTTDPPVLEVDQQQMPGRANAYTANAPQRFTQFVGTQFFFTGVTNPQGVGFGYTSQVNWFEAAGIPISTFDDAGRENAYPLMRIQAVSLVAIGAAPANAVLATLDTVVPVSGEADCKVCHGHPQDLPAGTLNAGVATVALGSNVARAINDPQAGDVPDPVSQEWAADVNILRLHDLRHSTSLEARQPVVCQTCHYTPALDLAQFGPNTPEEAAHKSMSAVMHKAHGDLRNQAQFATLFPPMPGPVGRNVSAAQDVLNQTCYMCHPGRRTQCMRGAMGQAGVVCQDCHGDMAQVGTDFSRDVSPENPGAFIVAADFYTNPATPRVPWANEPGCGSCHTGDASANGRPAPPAGQTYIPAADGIRLLQAYRTGDAKATPIVPTNRRFAENVVTAAENPAAVNNPKLYRVSTGHGGLFCEACHGSTHAEWANQPTQTLANANDNKTPQQLQGHNGTIIECSTCHGTANLGNTLGGPHGMHPVGNTGFARGGHEDLADDNPNACRACHGQNGQGTVLSRAAAPRSIPNEGQTVTFTQGQMIGCTHCHENEL